MKGKMKRLLAGIILLSILGTPAISQASMVDFEDLTFSNSTVSNGYNNLDWDNFWLFTPSGVSNSYNFNYSMPSGNMGVYNGSMGQAKIISSAPFALKGAYFSSMENYSGDGPEFIIEGYLNDELVNTASMALSGDQFKYFDLNFDKVDKVIFGVHAGYYGSRYWVMDDLKITASVPLPGAAWLLGTGLVLFAGTQRRPNR